MIEALSFGSVSRSIAFIAEFFTAIWFFKPIEDRTEARFRWMGLLALASIVWLYYETPAAAEMFAAHSTYNYAVQCARLLLHWFAAAGFAALRKEIGLKAAVYLGGFFTVLYLTAQNVRFVIALLDSLLGMGGALTGFGVYITILVECAMVMAVHKWIDLSGIRAVGWIRWALLILTMLLGLFFKWSLTTMRNVFVQNALWLDMLVYALCAIAGLVLVLFLFEINQQAQEQQRQSELEQMSLNYEMQNAKRALQTNNDMRRLYHDMKNHLLAIQGMAEDGGRVEEYLSELLPRFEGYESQVSTGNAVVDALLSEKIQRAALDGIRFNVCLDLKALEHVKSVDLITIFGNAVDNAVEAVQMLPEGTERMIYLKSSSFANLTALRFSNQFTGRLTEENGVLPTGKKDKGSHGIGLSSITQAAGRYGGTVSTRIDNESKWFSLMVMLPDKA